MMAEPKTIENRFLQEPDDTIYVSTDLYHRLILPLSKSKEPPKEGYIRLVDVPGDLLIGQTVPLPCFRFVWDERFTGPCTVWTFSDCVVFRDDQTNVFSEAEFEPDNNRWAIRTHRSKPLSESEGDGLHAGLGLWYGIQLCLLHPTIKDVFQRPTIQKEYTRDGTGKNRKRVTRYVRKHYITVEDIDEALHGKGNFTRKTMAWYVIGHWRVYKNGKRKFIKGHWRGPLREAKKSFDGGRIRELKEAS